MSGIRRRTALVAAAGAPFALAGEALTAGTAEARSASGVEALERLLAIERRLESTYEAALERGALAERPRRAPARSRARARASAGAGARRGGRRAPVASVPPPGLRRALDRGGAELARFALALEAEAVGAYADALATLDEPGLRQPLGSIMACEGQHLVSAAPRRRRSSCRAPSRGGRVERPGAARVAGRRLPKDRPLADRRPTDLRPITE